MDTNSPINKYLVSRQSSEIELSPDKMNVKSFISAISTNRFAFELFQK